MSIGSGLLPNHPPVLMYHFFEEGARASDPKRLFTSTEALQSHLRYMQSTGRCALSLEQYLDVINGGTRRSNRSYYLLTIDDAHESAVQLAAPVLQSHRVPAILFVPAGLIGGVARWARGYEDERLASVSDLHMALDLGIDLGVHGLDHRPMVDMSQDDLRAQVVEARNELAKATGYLAKAFAYPYGAHDAAARSAVKDAGYSVGYAVHKHASTLAMSRIGVSSLDNPSSLARKLSLRNRAARNALEYLPMLRPVLRSCRWRRLAENRKDRT